MNYKEWREVKLGDICEVKGGKRLPKGINLVKQKNSHPYIRIRDMYQHKNLEINEEFEYVDDDTFEKIKRYIVNSGDVIVAIVGNTIGLVSKVGKSLDNASLTENCVKLINLNACISDFLYYHLISKNGQGEIKKGIVGTSQPKLPIYNVQNIAINLPSVNEQKSIVAILSCLDDKIELNNHINKNIEEIALAIFKSWFVDFEPFQEGEFEDSELGRMPKGWGVGKLGDSPITKLITPGIGIFEGEKIYLATADVENTNIKNDSTKVTMNNKPSRANMQPKVSSVWFAKMKDSRKLLYVDSFSKELLNDYIFSTGFAGITCLKDSLYYIWCILLSENFDVLKNSLCNGTTMEAINNENINRINIFIPDEKTLKIFNDMMIPIFHQFYDNKQQNSLLTTIRDSLLPKLLSGEIRVPIEEVR